MQYIIGKNNDGEEKARFVNSGFVMYSNLYYSASEKHFLSYLSSCRNFINMIFSSKNILHDSYLLYDETLRLDLQDSEVLAPA